VDEDGRAGETHVQHRHEALASGEHLGLVAVLAQERARLLDGLRPLVAESHGLHLSSSQTRPGVSGTSTCSSPSASATAFAIAAGTLIVPPSPSPFAPSGVKGEGVSRWPIWSSGRSGAVGHR